MSGIHRKLRWIAILVPLALLAMIAADGLSWTDIGVVAFVAMILALFVFLTGFVTDALERVAPPSEQ